LIPDVAENDRAARPMEVRDLGQPPVPRYRDLVDVGRPPRIGSVTQPVIERQIGSPDVEARRGQEFGVGIRLPVPLHVEVSVEFARRRHDPDVAEVVERRFEVGGYRSV
jgi:hypothetical protein